MTSWLPFANRCSAKCVCGTIFSSPRMPCVFTISPTTCKRMFSTPFRPAFLEILY